MATRMHGGHLRRRLMIERAVDDSEGPKGVARTWEEVGAVWAQVRLRRGGAVDRGERPGLDNIYAITMRWRDDIDGDCRLRDGERLLAILSRGDVDGRRMWLSITAREETP